jgi:DNA excision repair protein ERCC-4
MKAAEVIIAIDTREQRPYRFSKSVVETLETGDYSVAGLEDRVAVERKRPQELFLCAGRDRERFVRELERLARFDYAALVIEGSLKTLLEPSAFSRVSPKAVLNSLVSWSIRYGVHIFFADSRRLSRALTYRILEKYSRYRQEVENAAE